MTAKILNGLELALSIRRDLKNKINHMENKPRLAIVLVGNNKSSQIYVRNKIKVADEIGIETSLHMFDENVSQTEIKELILQLNSDADVNGIMIQLPLPKHINEQEILESVDPKKDVDGFHPLNIGLLQNGSKDAILAATPKGIIRLLEEYSINLEGKNALVIGRSKIVGKPIAMLLLNKNCTVTIAHSKTKNLQFLINNADIIISACGCPKMIQGSSIKEGAIIVDVGINHIDNKLCGDVDFESAKEIASFITPVPGGVGPMTIAMLLENTLIAYEKQNKI